MSTTNAQKERLNILVPQDLRAAVDEYCERTPGIDGRPISVGEFMRRGAWEKLDREAQR
jgi:hypothetical protein